MKTAIAAAEPPEPDHTPATTTSAAYSSGGTLLTGVSLAIHTGPAETVLTWGQWTRIRLGGW